MISGIYVINNIINGHKLRWEKERNRLKETNNDL